MHRLHLLRWLALPVGLLLSTQCVDSLSDDCTKTLTCGDEPRVTLDANCLWRFPDGGVWTGGPKRDEIDDRWEWPDGTPSDTQDFKCGGAAGDAGADGGDGQPDCTRPGVVCDTPQVCDAEGTRRCVECLSDAECSANVGTGDAGAATVCDRVLHECVQCLTNQNCSGDAPVCKTVAADSKANRCVECKEDVDCGPSEPVCDQGTNECTLRCTSTTECGGEKPVCNTTRQVCVECLEATDCTNSTATQCSDANECVQCVDDAPCAAAGQVCDTTSHTCVQCRDNLQCGSVTGAPVCDSDSKACVQCLNDAQCTDAGASRCNTVSHVCVGCNANAQCEGGLLCKEGQCVECLSNANCTTGAKRQCETVNGICVECFNSLQCPLPDLARCETVAAGLTKYTCVGCLGNADCGGRPNVGGLCRIPGNQVCVDCVNDGDCADDHQLSRCGNGGECAPCTLDAQCDAFEGLRACLPGVECVECVNNTHCAANGNGPVCKTSDVGAAAGPAEVNTCVECISNANCTNPAASLCSNNACVPCQANADCGSQAGLGVCDLSAVGGPRCVECTGQFPGACGSNVCNGQTKVCSEFGARSGNGCGQCVSDAQCAVGQLCTRQIFQNQPVGTPFFCFPAATGASCAAFANFRALRLLTTVDGTAGSVCQLAASTCTALADQLEPESCDDDADCGEPARADGVCVIGAGETEGLCATACGNNTDCPPGTPSCALVGASLSPSCTF